MHSTTNNSTDYKKHETIFVYQDVLKHSIHHATTESSLTKICGLAPLYQKEGKDGCKDGYVGIMSFSGTVSFSVMFGVPKETATYFAKSFMGFDIPYDSPDMADIIGELINILAGTITAFLEKQELIVQMSLPVVIAGNEVKVLLLEGFLSFCLHFLINDLPFWVKVITNH